MKNDLKISLRKPSYPVNKALKAYMQKFNRTIKLPIFYDDLLRFQGSVEVFDKNDKDTLWVRTYYSEFDRQEIDLSLKKIYTKLHSDGNEATIPLLNVDAIDYCTFGNSKPFRIKIRNILNDNYAYFYVKKADASRIYGLELEHMLSPHNLNFLVYEDTLIEEHISGIPGDEFITNMKPCGEYNIGLIAKQEYNELIEEGEWEDGAVTVFDEVHLDIKQPEGQPELRFAASHSDFVELDIVDELNGFCGVETIEVQCEGMVDDTNVKISKVPNTDELLVPSTVVISGLSSDNSYTCSAMVQYSQIAGNQTLNVSSKYHPASNPLVVKTSQEIQLFAEPKSNSNTVIYILVAGGVILIIVIAIIICKRRKSGKKDFVETANENVVHHKDAEKDMGSTDVEVEEEK